MGKSQFQIVIIISMFLLIVGQTTTESCVGTSVSQPTSITSPVEFRQPTINHDLKRNSMQNVCLACDLQGVLFKKRAPDLNYTEGSTENYLVWHADYFTNYTVLIDDKVVQHGGFPHSQQALSEGRITITRKRDSQLSYCNVAVNVDGLSPGAHIIQLIISMDPSYSCPAGCCSCGIITGSVALKDKVQVTVLSKSQFTPTPITRKKGEIQWNQTYGKDYYDFAYSTIQTIDGGFALAGSSEPSLGGLAGGQSFWLVKTDLYGNMQWNQTYNNAHHDEAYSVIQTTDGGFLLAGYTWNELRRTSDAWLVRTNPNGMPLWNQTYGGSAQDRAFEVIQTKDGGFAFVGWTESYAIGERDAWLVKTDFNGHIEWNQTYGGLDWDVANSLLQVEDGGFILVGMTKSYGAGAQDAWLVKTNPFGVIEWTQTYGGTQDDGASSVIQTKEGGFAFSGSTTSFGKGGYDGWLVKTEPQGTILWNQTYGGSRNDYSISLIGINDSGFVLAGRTESFDAAGSDAWVIKTDATGITQWNRTYGDGDLDRANSIIQTEDGGLILGGCTAISLDADFWLVKIAEFTSPGITEPSDVRYIEGTMDNIIVWAIEDRHPGTYEVFCNNSMLIEKGIWKNGPLAVNIDGLAPNTYNCTIVVRDFYNNYASDSVWITVIPESEVVISVSESGASILLLVLSVSEIIIFISVAAFITHRRQHK